VDWRTPCFDDVSACNNATIDLTNGDAFRCLVDNLALGNETTLADDCAVAVAARSEQVRADRHRYTVVTQCEKLLQHCCHTAVTLLSHSCYTLDLSLQVEAAYEEENLAREEARVTRTLPCWPC
jgi:hypothetical protein